MQIIKKYIQDAFLSKKWQQMQVQIKDETTKREWDSAEGE